jgi:hypothetical protein
MRILELILPKNSDQKIPGLHPPDRHDREQLRKDIDQANDDIDYDEDFGSLEEELTIGGLQGEEARELLAALFVSGSVAAAAIISKIKDWYKTHTAEKAIEKMEKSGVRVSYNTYLEVEPLLNELRQAIHNNDGETAQQLVRRIQDIVKQSQSKKINEAVHRVPLSEDDFDRLKEVLNHYIPATLSEIYLGELIQDDELDSQIMEFEKRDPNADIRPLIVEWIDRVMPDQKHRFYPEQKFQNRQGNMSVVHGYDPGYFRGTNNPITGNAYGRF